MSRIHQPSPGGFRSGGDLAVLVLSRPLLWVARSRLGRRLAAAATLALVTAALVITLYDHPDIGGGRAGLSDTRPAVTGLRTPAAAASRSPERAAVSWYARQLGVPQARVRALQRRRIGHAEARVMVIADLEGGRLPTAVVTVRRDRTGWKVAP
jgi:hypothetical protein